MTITCKRLDALLLEGDDASMAAAARHARGCDALPRGSSTTGTTSPYREVAAHHVAERHALAAHRARAAERPPSRNRMLAIAAAISVTVRSSAAAPGSAAHVRIAQNKRLRQAILRATALDEVERAEAAHVAAIDQLEKLARLEAR